MNGFNQRYDFDRTQRPKPQGARLRSILILLAVLAVTGGIIYLIIPHGGPKKPEKKPETKIESGAKKPGETEVAPTTGGAAPKGTDTPVTTDTAVKGKSDGEPSGTAVTTVPGAPTEGGVDDPLERAKTIVVQPGEDLGTIARRHHTTVEGIKHFNGLKNDMIKNGQTLKVIPGPWRITVRNELTLEHAPDGQWLPFKSFPADANGVVGKFVISSMHRHPVWTDAHGGRFEYGSPENPYGDYLLKLAKPENAKNPLLGFGIHGVNDKAANLKNCGRTCIHVGAGDIELLYYLVCPGTEVTVIPGETVRKPEM